MRQKTPPSRGDRALHPREQEQEQPYDAPRDDQHDEPHDPLDAQDSPLPTDYDIRDTIEKFAS